MNAWQQLAIEPTTDQRSIKRAYAKLLKQIDQDTQAQAFIELRSALEQALWESQFLDDEDNENDVLASPVFTDHLIPSPEETHVLEDIPQDTHPVKATDRPTTTEIIIQDHEAQIEEQSPVFGLLEQVSDALYADQIDDQTFAQFQQLISQQIDLDLITQIQIKDRLAWVLPLVVADLYDPNYFRFLECWLEYYPDDLEHFDEVYDSSQYSQQLQQRLVEYAQLRQLLQNTSETRFIELDNLIGKKPFTPLKVFQLQAQLGKDFPGKNILSILSQYNINNSGNNLNYAFLKSLNNFSQFIILDILFFIISYGLIQTLFPSIDQGYLFFGIFALTAIFATYIQPMLHAWILTQEHLDKKLLRAGQFWLFSGLILFALEAVIQSPLYALLSYLWTLYSIIYLGCLQQYSNNDLSSLFQSAFIRSDKWMISAGLIMISVVLLCITYGLSDRGFALIHALDFSKPAWAMVYGLIPVAILLLINSFAPLAQSIRLYNSEGTFPLQVKRTINLIPVIIPLLALLYFSPTESTSSNVSLLFYILVFASLALTFVPTYRYSQILKYISYLLVLALSLYTYVLALFVIYLLFIATKTEYQASKQF